MKGNSQIIHSLFLTKEKDMINNNNESYLHFI